VAAPSRPAAEGQMSPSRRPCLGPGAFHLSEPGESRCAEHRLTKWASKAVPFVRCQGEHGGSHPGPSIRRRRRSHESGAPLRRLSPHEDADRGS
jgi:hypothetical protein